MRRKLEMLALSLAGCLCFCPQVDARPDHPGSFVLDPEGPRLGRKPPPGVAQDTTWIADWTFDGSGATCDPNGWAAVDEYVRNDGSVFWGVGPDYDGQGLITGNAAILRRHDPCWAHDGYGNGWDQSIVLRYRGAAATLSFDFTSDSEPTYDYVLVEADSLCLSGTLAGETSPPGWPASFRHVLLSFDGPNPSGHVTALALPDFGLPDSTHCVYIRFVSDGGASDQDGGYMSSIAAGLVVDNITVTGSPGYTEDFEATLDPNVALVNSAPSLPYGTFARLVHHPLDLDPVAEDSTCAWVFYDSTFVCNGGTSVPPCVRPLADNSILSPWVDLSGSGSFVLAFREWPSNSGSGSCTVRTWAVRTRTRIPNLDTPAPDDSIDCQSAWSGGFSFPTSDSWVSRVYDLSSRVPAGARAIQVRFRVMPFPYLIGHPPNPSCLPSPGGPYIDHVRIGRVGTTSDGPPSQHDAVAMRTILYPNTPNPFNPVTRIRFDLARSGNVNLTIYDAVGRRVRGLLDVHLEAGLGHSVTWDGLDDAGGKVPSGVYFCRLVSGDATSARTLVLVE
jgi:FlgD Ig-like domain